MRKRIRLTESDLHRVVKEAVNAVLKEQSEYEAFNDAVQTIQKHGPYKFSAWLSRHDYLEPLDAEAIYSSAENYVQELEQNNERLDVQPRKIYGYDGQHYNDENLNVYDTNGRFSMDILGNGSRFRGVQAIKRGSDMDIEDAMKEYDRLNNR